MSPSPQGPAARLALGMWTLGRSAPVHRPQSSTCTCPRRVRGGRGHPYPLVIIAKQRPQEDQHVMNFTEPPRFVDWVQGVLEP
jgi:hypothetical protein